MSSSSSTKDKMRVIVKVCGDQPFNNPIKLSPASTLLDLRNKLISNRAFDLRIPEQFNFEYEIENERFVLYPSQEQDETLAEIGTKIFYVIPHLKPPAKTSRHDPNNSAEPVTIESSARFESAAAVVPDATAYARRPSTSREVCGVTPDPIPRARIVPARKSTVVGKDKAKTVASRKDSARKHPRPKRSIRGGRTSYQVRVKVEETSNAVGIEEEETSNPVRVKEEEKELPKYGDRYLLQRQHPNGIARLGGNLQETFPMLAINYILSHDYPIPLHLPQEGDRKVTNPILYVYACYNNLWQPLAPRYAGQRVAWVDLVPEPFREGKCKGKSFAMFVRRSRTARGAKSEGRLLGWEYVGNYKYVPGDEAPMSNIDPRYLEELIKKKISNDIFSSSKSARTWGRRRLDKWREKLCEALEEAPPGDEAVQAAKNFLDRVENESSKDFPSLSARARALGFDKDTTCDEALSKIIVELHEYHTYDRVEFVLYDERIYNFCKGGKTNRTREGKIIEKPSDAPAKAQDFYDFCNAQSA